MLYISDLINKNPNSQLLRFGRTLGIQIGFQKLIKSYKEADRNDIYNKYNYFWSYVLPHGVSDLMTIFQFYMDHYLYLHKVFFFSNIPFSLKF